jgi:hypothetical protein
VLSLQPVDDWVLATATVLICVTMAMN